MPKHFDGVKMLENNVGRLWTEHGEPKDKFRLKPDVISVLMHEAFIEGAKSALPSPLPHGVPEDRRKLPDRRLVRRATPERRAPENQYARSLSMRSDTAEHLKTILATAMKRSDWPKSQVTSKILNSEETALVASILRRAHALGAEKAQQFKSDTQ